MTRHVVPVTTYIAVFAALIALTVTTVAVSKVDLGPFNVVVAITIAVVKGALVVWFFMHLKQASSLTRLAAGAGLLWLAILIAFTVSDYASRNWTRLPIWWR